MFIVAVIKFYFSLPLLYVFEGTHIGSVLVLHPRVTLHITERPRISIILFSSPAKMN